MATKQVSKQLSM